jgi:hypothetical protein
MKRIQGQGLFACPIVGESHYQKALELICGGRTEDGEDDRPVVACLNYEPTNRYDPQAVRVDIGGFPVGYLSRDMAKAFRRAVQKAGGEDLTEFEVAAVIRGGWDRGPDDRGHYGVWLDLDFIGEIQ